MNIQNVFIERLKNINNRETKNSLMSLFWFLPDKLYLQIMYRFIIGKKLNLTSPKTFNEKMQWLKLYDRKPIYTTMVDKYEVKKYVGNIIGQRYIIPTLGIYNQFDDIDFSNLPNQFFLKCTHDSGGFVAVRDKSSMSMDFVKKKIEKSLKINYFNIGREWPYKNVKPRILVEKFMGDSKNSNLMNYKFYCFSGKVKFLYIAPGMQNHETAKMNYVTLDWKKTEYRKLNYKEFDGLPPAPKNLDEMIQISEVLSVNMPFCRVDLYEINGSVYFGELTLYPGGGFNRYDNKTDESMGSLLSLPL